jgi:DNA-binding XRE family transcriptional regulator
MITIARDPKNRVRFILTIGSKDLHLSSKEAQHLYRRLRALNVWDDGTLRGKIVRRLIEFREEKDMTQGAIAKKLGVSRMQIHRWETGSCMPSSMARAGLKKLGVI